MTEPVCPDCGGTLADACEVCGRPVPRLREIPDLLAVEDRYLSSVEDAAIARRLDEAFDGRGFPSLLDLLYDAADVPERARPGQTAHILGAKGRAAAWQRELPEEGPILDLGCGPGSFLVEAARSREVVGCDVALRWLMIARKRLDEEGLPHVRLVRGSAEKLPWPDDSFAAVVAGDMIEHVSDQAATIAEARRVLRPGGVLLMTTPNRFSLGPEPHVGLLGVGFLPRPWMSRYVRLRGRGDYRAVRNLGGNEWRRLLDAGPFADWSLVAPEIPAEDLAFMSPVKRFAARTYNRLRSTPPALWFGPTFRIVCRKEGPVPPRDSRPPPAPREAES